MSGSFQLPDTLSVLPSPPFPIVIVPDEPGVTRLGGSIYDVYRILGFFDPSSPLFRKSILFVRKFAAFLDPSPSFSAHVIYGSPLACFGALKWPNQQKLCDFPVLFLVGCIFSPETDDSN